MEAVPAWVREAALSASRHDEALRTVPVADIADDSLLRGLSDGRPGGSARHVLFEPVHGVSVRLSVEGAPSEQVVVTVSPPTTYDVVVRNVDSAGHLTESPALSTDPTGVVRLPLPAQAATSLLLLREAADRSSALQRTAWLPL